MKPIGYIIYHFWDMTVTWNGKSEIHNSEMHNQYKKRVYTRKESAEEAVMQMKKIDQSNTSYHILPVYTLGEDYDKMKEAYLERVEETKKKNEEANGKL